MAPRPGWKGLDGTVYDTFDERLAGYGNPPNDPEWQRLNPGTGQVRLRQVVVDTDTDTDKLVEVVQ